MKKPIPDVTDILESFDKKAKFKIRKPNIAKEKAMKDLKEREESPNGELGFADFSTITLGDLISAAHTFNRECMSSMTADQRTAYFTLFAAEERANRIIHHYTYIQ